MRTTVLNQLPERSGAYVLYWMQQAQRTRCNHALEYAVAQANRLRLPLLVCFGLTPSYPEANARHYAFMLEGLAAVARNLKKRRIGFVIDFDSPDRAALARARDAALVVCDRGYLHVQRAWRRTVARGAPCAVIEIESDAVVPVEYALPKSSWSAAVLRPRILKALETFLVRPDTQSLRIDSTALGLGAAVDPARILATLDIDRKVAPVTWLRGGENEAAAQLDEFIGEKLDRFGELRNDPGLDYGSHMSPYLHFGQISPVDIALQIRDSHSPGADRYLEELIVRRELGINMAWYDPAYESFETVPPWARATLDTHARDNRPYTYTRSQLESARTHDPYWNAAQTEMVVRGTMHGYMRMYWGKKIIEWTRTPQEAYRTMTTLNNRYLLDGRDPNGYAGIAWCLGKHDRPWKERPVFGTVRYMNAAGLERKFDIERYVKRVETLGESRATSKSGGD